MVLPETAGRFQDLYSAIPQTDAVWVEELFEFEIDRSWIILLEKVPGFPAEDEMPFTNPVVAVLEFVVPLVRFAIVLLLTVTIELPSTKMQMPVTICAFPVAAEDALMLPGVDKLPIVLFVMVVVAIVLVL